MWKPFEFEKNFFPVIILPKEVEVILTKVPPLVAEYPYFEPRKPAKSAIASKWIFLVISPILLLLSLIGILKIFITIIVISSIAILWIFEKRDIVISYKKEYAKYEVALQKYQKQKEDYLAEKEEKHSDVYIWLYQRLFLKEFLDTVKKPNLKFFNIKGESEKAFELTLNFWFPERVFTNYSFESPAKIIPFSPDFIYQDNNNLHIDIEIDEPYSTIDRKPLHHLLFDDYYMDSARDRFFSDKKGWIVVRFAEEQIKNQRNECCKVIAHIIYVLTGDEYFSNRLKEYSFPKPIKRWTYEEALEMARSNSKHRGVRNANNMLLYQNNENFHYKLSFWNEKIKLEDCPNPAADYGIIILDEETQKLLKDYDDSPIF